MLRGNRLSLSERENTKKNRPERLSNCEIAKKNKAFSIGCE